MKKNNRGPLLSERDGMRALTPEGRAKERAAVNMQRSHLSSGSASTGLSEYTKPERPEARFKANGVKNVPKAKRGSAFATRKY